jgi:hypothetical protein
MEDDFDIVRSNAYYKWNAFNGDFNHDFNEWHKQWQEREDLKRREMELHRRYAREYAEQYEHQMWLPKVNADSILQRIRHIISENAPKDLYTEYEYTNRVTSDEDYNYHYAWKFKVGTKILTCVSFEATQRQHKVHWYDLVNVYEDRMWRFIRDVVDESRRGEAEKAYDTLEGCMMQCSESYAYNMPDDHVAGKIVGAIGSMRRANKFLTKAADFIKTSALEVRQHYIEADAKMEEANTFADRTKNKLIKLFGATAC